MIMILYIAVTLIILVLSSDTQLLLNDNIGSQNSVLININSTPRASVTEINRNSKDMSKDSILTSRNSFGINVSHILNASSIENSNKQSLKSDAEINIMASSCALTNSSNNKSKSMATEITNLTNSNTKINKITKHNFNEFLLKGLITENPAFIDSIEDDKGFESLVRRSNHEQ